MDEKLNVKIGDEVFVEWNYGKIISKVVKITPKGSIRLSNGQLFDEYGRLKTSDCWNSSRIIPITEESKKKYLEEKFIKTTINKLNKISSLTYEQAVKIDNILDNKLD